MGSRTHQYSPERIAAAWLAAPHATTSSELILLLGSLPLKKSDMTWGIQVEHTNKDNVVHISLVNLRVTKNLLNGLQVTTE